MVVCGTCRLLCELDKKPGAGSGVLVVQDKGRESVRVFFSSSRGDIMRQGGLYHRSKESVVLRRHRAMVRIG